MWLWLHRWASPKFFYHAVGRWIPILWLLCIGFLSYGLIMGLLFSPADYQQGEAYRIIYIHVPSATLSLLVFAIMGMMSGIYLLWHIKLADVIAKASAPLGAVFTLLALFTGSLWGKPMWGTWWIWDARLTSELILLFLYVGIMGLRSSITSIESAARATSIMTLVGLVDLPIIHYSVDWWNTLHQSATILKWGKPSIAPTMMYPLLAMLVGFVLYYLAALCMRVRTELTLREQRAAWVQQLREATPC